MDMQYMICKTMLMHIMKRNEDDDDEGQSALWQGGMEGERKEAFTYPRR